MAFDMGLSFIAGMIVGLVVGLFIGYVISIKDDERRDKLSVSERLEEDDFLNGDGTY